MSTNAKVTFEVTWIFEDGGQKTFRTDEWNESILRERLIASGRKIVEEKRVQVR